jgi:hypothetical protein
MTTPNRTCQAPGCTVEVPAVLEIEGLCLNHYLDGAFAKLAAATQDFQNGQDLDYRTMDWLLAQVDFAIESLGQEDGVWDADQRSKLLELLLGVANLNEYVRHGTVIARHSD